MNVKIMLTTVKKITVLVIVMVMINKKSNNNDNDDDNHKHHHDNNNVNHNRPTKEISISRPYSPQIFSPGARRFVQLDKVIDEHSRRVFTSPSAFVNIRTLNPIQI